MVTSAEMGLGCRPPRDFAHAAGRDVVAWLDLAHPEDRLATGLPVFV